MGWGVDGARGVCDGAGSVMGRGECDGVRGLCSEAGRCAMGQGVRWGGGQRAVTVRRVG